MRTDCHGCSAGEVQLLVQPSYTPCVRVLMSYGVVGRGGDAIQVQELADAFRALGHDVKIVGSHKLEPYGFGGAGGRLRSRLRRLPWWGRDFVELGLNVRTLVRARRLLRRGAFDLVFHRAAIYDFVGARLARSCPVIAHLDAPFGAERAFHGERAFGSLHRLCMRRLGEAARLVVTMTAASQDHYAGLGIPREKILVAPNGISSRLLGLGTALAEPSPPHVDSGEYTIGFVGSLSRWHRVDMLLEALGQLNGEKYRLCVVGYGAEFDRLLVRARELGVHQRVQWLGALPHQQALQEIARFDIAVLPGTLPTGAPIKLFEYAALARPSIAPDLPNLRALFTEEELCFVEPENPGALVDAIVQLCENPDRARALGQRAQVRVREDYTWEKIVSGILDAVHVSDHRR